MGQINSLEVRHPLGLLKPRMDQMQDIGAALEEGSQCKAITVGKGLSNPTITP